MWINSILRTHKTTELKLTFRSLEIHLFCSFSLDTPLYQNEGCFSTKTETDGVYLGIFPPNTFSTVDQCSQIARRQDFTEFALFEGGLCRGGHDFQEIYSDQGTSLSCSNGVGGKDSVALYTVTKSGRVELQYKLPHLIGWLIDAEAQRFSENKQLAQRPRIIFQPRALSSNIPESQKVAYLFHDPPFNFTRSLSR